jgi:TP901-1 family phage major tail protein
MGAQKGKDLLIKVNSGSGFETVAGVRASRIALNAASVDVTTADSSGRWRELLASAGVRTASVSGSGIFKDAASDALIRNAFFAGELLTAQMVVPDFGVIEGVFQIASLEYGGDHDGEATFEISLSSAGEITFTGV